MLPTRSKIDDLNNSHKILRIQGSSQTFLNALICLIIYNKITLLSSDTTFKIIKNIYIDILCCRRE